MHFLLFCEKFIHLFHGLISKENIPPPPRKFSVTHKWKHFRVCQIPSDLKMVLGRAQQRGPHSATVHNEGLLHESDSWSDTQGVEKISVTFLFIRSMRPSFPWAKVGQSRDGEILVWPFRPGSKKRPSDRNRNIYQEFLLPPRPLKPQLSCCVFTERHGI